MDNDNINTIIGSQKAVITNQLSNKNSNASIASLVFGIISLIFCWVFVCPIITGIIGIVVGLVSIIKKREGFGLAIAGIATSLIGLLLNIIISAITLLGIIME